IENMELDQQGHTNYVEVWNCSKQDISVNGLKLMVKWWDATASPPGLKHKEQYLDDMMTVNGVISSGEHIVFATRRDPINSATSASNGVDFVSFVTCHGNGDKIWPNDAAKEDYRVFQMADPGTSSEWDCNHLRGEVWIQEETSPNITLAICFYDLLNEDGIGQNDNPNPEYLANCAQELKSPFAPRRQDFGSSDWIQRWTERYGFTASGTGIFASPGKTNNDTSFTNTEPYKTINKYAILDEPAVSAGMLRNMYLAEGTYNNTFSNSDLKEIAHRFTNNCIVIAAEQYSSHAGANWTWDANADPNGSACFKSSTNGRTNWEGAYDTFTYTSGVNGVYVPDGYYDVVLYGKYKNDADKEETSGIEDEVNSFRMDFYDYDPAAGTYADSGSSNTIYYILPNHSAWKTTWDGMTSWPYYFDRVEAAPYCINGGEFEFKLAAWWRNSNALGVPDDESYFDYLVLIPRAVNNSVVAGSTMPLTGRVPGRININTASKVVLQALPRIDSTLAGNIITEINNNGPFVKIGDILDVTGITPEIFEKIANLITVRSDIFEVIIQAERIIDKNKNSAFDSGDKIVARKRMRAIVDRSTTPVTVILMKEEEI
ncbi:MAG: helix-hairpin-helix domain-containing protein, partial [Candidatus Aureabacteria bacterium]|nr:helix-hairpin-helix domain-containing protein [Candidatus Auribacterota bacterium]